MESIVQTVTVCVSVRNTSSDMLERLEPEPEQEPVSVSIYQTVFIRDSFKMTTDRIS